SFLLLLLLGLVRLGLAGILLGVNRHRQQRDYRSHRSRRNDSHFSFPPRLATPTQIGTAIMTAPKSAVSRRSLDNKHPQDWSPQSSDRCRRVGQLKGRCDTGPAATGGWGRLEFLRPPIAAAA